MNVHCTIVNFRDFDSCLSVFRITNCNCACFECLFISVVSVSSSFQNAIIFSNADKAMNMRKNVLTSFIRAIGVVFRNIIENILMSRLRFRHFDRSDLAFSNWWPNLFEVDFALEASLTAFDTFPSINAISNDIYISPHQTIPAMTYRLNDR